MPTTLPALTQAYRTGALAGPGLPAHAVTPALREWYVGGELEELEYAAMAEAAEASLRLLAAMGAAPHRRVVVAADVPDSAVVPGAVVPGAVVPGGARFRSSVVVSAVVALAAVASVHLDEAASEPAVQAAIGALAAADAGDDDARFLVDETEAHELLWYDASEIGPLLASSP